LLLYARQDAGCEVAVHAMHHDFSEDNTKAVSLVDASNAFSSLNHKVALHNLQYLCPSLAIILLNTSRHDVCLLTVISCYHERGPHREICLPQ